jgi:hypothetical protein
MVAGAPLLAPFQGAFRFWSVYPVVPLDDSLYHRLPSEDPSGPSFKRLLADDFRETQSVGSLPAGDEFQIRMLSLPSWVTALSRHRRDGAGIAKAMQ